MQNITKYVLKVWSATVIAGAILTFLILSLFTEWAGEINNIIDLLRVSFIAIFIGALVSIPIAIAFYIVTKILIKNRTTNIHIKIVLTFLSLFLIFLLFVYLFEQGYNFVWTYSSTAIFFYSYSLIMALSICAFKINETKINGL